MVSAAGSTDVTVYPLNGWLKIHLSIVATSGSIAGLIQNVLSAVLIFLLLLGIRNLLKLK